MTTETMTLTDFLLARIAEDESREGVTARVLAECEAKRRIVELHHPDRHLENWYWTQRRCAECGGLWHRVIPNTKPTEIGPEQGCATLRWLAHPCADHPDYRDEWKP